jgi:hypothetical protein
MPTSIDPMHQLLDEEKNREPFVPDDVVEVKWSEWTPSKKVQLSSKRSRKTAAIRKKLNAAKNELKQTT